MCFQPRGRARLIIVIVTKVDVRSNRTIGFEVLFVGGNPVLGDVTLRSAEFDLAAAD